MRGLRPSKRQMINDDSFPIVWTWHLSHWSRLLSAQRFSLLIRAFGRKKSGVPASRSVNHTCYRTCISIFPQNAQLCDSKFAVTCLRNPIGIATEFRTEPRFEGTPIHVSWNFTDGLNISVVDPMICNWKDSAAHIYHTTNYRLSLELCFEMRIEMLHLPA
ncbi:uncharacterized protein LOC111261271 isoform X2 [Varroa jacobsoni]|uniref:uncharacterized protein LOC111261271 isoform X2 n=1 Tax=Varroa jacobsoni TaxID=62625 RepID=UPI000BFA6FFB|nr:uncharacterized protein LOC111261271 isoform X2 [Varroa jacobsoni]